jgi:hypothetical protein
VLPGDYRVTLTIAGREAGTRTGQVQGDPQIKISDADRRIHHDTALMLHELQRPLNEATAVINAAGEQVRAVQDLLTSVAGPPPALKEATDALAKRLAGLTQQLGAGNAPAGGRGGGGGAPGVRGQLTAVRSQILAFTALPTAAQMQQARDSRDEVARLIADLNDLLTAALPALFKALADNKLQPPQVKPIPPIKLDARTTQAPMQQDLLGSFKAATNDTNESKLLSPPGEHRFVSFVAASAVLRRVIFGTRESFAYEHTQN